jgi:hypothetical protein
MSRDGWLQKCKNEESGLVFDKQATRTNLAKRAGEGGGERGVQRAKGSFPAQDADTC